MKIIVWFDIVNWTGWKVWQGLVRCIWHWALSSLLQNTQQREVTNTWLLQPRCKDPAFSSWIQLKELSEQGKKKKKKRLDPVQAFTAFRNWLSALCPTRICAPCEVFIRVLRSQQWSTLTRCRSRLTVLLRAAGRAARFWRRGIQREKLEPFYWFFCYLWPGALQV